ncbi:hypothetical protein P9112_005325 [Eukaryota sp. TZLM1-RC]
MSVELSVDRSVNRFSVVTSLLSSNSTIVWDKNINRAFECFIHRLKEWSNQLNALHVSFHGCIQDLHCLRQIVHHQLSLSKVSIVYKPPRKLNVNEEVLTSILDKSLLCLLKVKQVSRSYANTACSVLTSKTVISLPLFTGSLFTYRESISPQFKRTLLMYLLERCPMLQEVHIDANSFIPEIAGLFECLPSGCRLYVTEKNPLCTSRSKEKLICFL